MVRTLKAVDTVMGQIFFSLLDEAGNRLAIVLATPYDARIVIHNVDNHLALTPEERLFCQMEVLKTVPH